MVANSRPNQVASLDHGPGCLAEYDIAMAIWRIKFSTGKIPIGKFYSVMHCQSWCFMIISRSMLKKAWLHGYATWVPSWLDFRLHSSHNFNFASEEWTSVDVKCLKKLDMK